MWPPAEWFPPRKWAFRSYIQTPRMLGMVDGKTGRSYKQAGGPQQTHIFVRRRYTSSVMLALAHRRPSPYMRRSLAQTWKAHQSQIPLCRIEFFDEIPTFISSCAHAKN